MKLWLKQQITKAHHPSSHPISMSFCGAQRAGFSEHQFVEPCEDPSFLAYCMLNPHPSKNDEDQDGDDATGLKKKTIQHTFRVACDHGHKQREKSSTRNMFPCLRHSKLFTWKNIAMDLWIHISHVDPPSPVLFCISSRGNPNVDPNIEDGYPPELQDGEHGPLRSMLYLSKMVLQLPGALYIYILYVYIYIFTP